MDHNPAKNDLLRIAHAAQIQFVRLQFTDLNGVLKSVEIPTHQLADALDGQTLFDGSAIEGFVRIEESDMYLRPDPDSWLVLPWSVDGRRFARLICDVCMPGGHPFAGDPRGILKRTLKQAATAGFSRVIIAFEIEFFLLPLDASGRPVAEPSDQASYFESAPAHPGELCRRDIVMTLRDMGIQTLTAHHEVAAGQHEVDFEPMPALQAADLLMTFKVVAKTIARRYGLHATFMPKPFHGVDGSGLHIHQSLYNESNAVFYDATDVLSLSDTARHYIAGLLAHAPALTAIFNPTVNSYKRLTPGYEAPTYVSWSAQTRSPFVRTSSRDTGDSSIELRSPDSACNPYLALAAALGAGLDGVMHELRPPAPIDRDVYTLSDTERLRLGILRLPSNLEQAVEALEEDAVVQESLGDHTYARIQRARTLEWEAYRRVVHPWEHQQYLDL